MKQRRNIFWTFKMNKCKHCKKENKENAKFCVNCGEKLGNEKRSKSERHSTNKKIGVLNFLKTGGRIIIYFFFGIIVLIALVAFSVKSFFALLLAGLGIFIASPSFNSFTEKRLKRKIPVWGKVIALIVLFYISVMLSSNSENSSNVNFPHTGIDELDLKGMSAEKVLDNYLGFLNYKRIGELLVNNLKRQKLSSGVVKDQLEADYNYMTELRSIFYDLKKACDEAKQLVADACDDQVISSLSLSTGFNNSITILSKNIIEQTDDLVKIKVESKIIGFSFNEKTETTRKTTYLLKKEDNVWKINDYIDEDNKLLSATLNLQERKKNDEQRLEKIRTSFAELKKLIEDLKKIYLLIGNLKTNVQNVLPNNKIINFDFDGYNNQTDKFVIEITYYFKEQWLVDDYLGFSDDATKIYKAIFTNSNQIMQVQITAKQKYNDNYGNEQEKFLGRSLMEKSTADKINWGSFDSSKLDQITQVAYYGDSFYKDLKDLQNQLESWQSIPSYGGGGFGYLPSSICTDAESQCQEYGECDTLEILKSQGMC